MSKPLWPRAVLTVALRGPGKVLLCASAVGWVALAWLAATHRLPHSVAGREALSSDFIVMWVAMIVAMGPPLLLREVGRLWQSSRRRLRPMAVACFLCGYVAVWLLAGVALCAWAIVGSARIAGAVAMVALWHASPLRQRCLNACHRATAWRVFGPAAQWDAIRYGVSTGRFCAASCGPLMFLTVLAADYHVTVMAVAAAVTTLERYAPARRPRWRLPLLPDRSPDWPDLDVAPHRPLVGWR